MTARHMGAALLGIGGLFASTVQAAGLDVSLSDDTANFLYLTETGSLGYGGADIGVGVFYNEDSDVVLTGQILVAGKPVGDKDSRLQFGVGGKVYAGEFDAIEEDLLAIAIGAQVRYLIPSTTPIGIAGEFFVAPDITSFGDTEAVREFNLRLELEVMPSTRGYLGYRRFEADLTVADEVELDDQLHIGIRINF